MTSDLNMQVALNEVLNHGAHSATSGSVNLSQVVTGLENLLKEARVTMKELQAQVHSAELKSDSKSAKAATSAELASSHKSASARVRVMTYNIRDSRADRSDNEPNHKARWWKSDLVDPKTGQPIDRRHRVLNEIETEKPDVLNLQEVSTPEQKDFIMKHLVDTGEYKVLKGADDKMILYKTSTMKVATDSKGEVTGSFNYDYDHKGVPTEKGIWGELVDKRTGHSFTDMDMHVSPGRNLHEPMCNIAGEISLGYNQMKDRVGAGTASIVAGDFSTDPDKNTFKDMFKGLGFNGSTFKDPAGFSGPTNKMNGNPNKGEPVTRHGASWTDDNNEPDNPEYDAAGHDDDGIFEQGGRVIDTKINTSSNAYLDSLGEGPAYTSDHFAVESDIEI